MERDELMDKIEELQNWGTENIIGTNERELWLREDICKLVMPLIKKYKNERDKKMVDIQNLEVIQLNTNKEGKLIAMISYQDTTVQDLNNGYSTIDVPVNVRTLQSSSRGNVLVDQSVKGESVVCCPLCGCNDYHKHSEMCGNPECTNGIGF